MFSSVNISFIIVFSLLCTVFAAKEKTSHFNIIYQFGDSLADTGNRIRQTNATSAFHISSLPYGMTYFHKPTGRFSNGLLVIDFIAKALNLSLLHPYMETNASFGSGVNFAVGGSTALNNSFFYERNISVPPTNVPLSHQLKWFKEHLKLVSDDRSQREEWLKGALFMMGEIGGNDFNAAFSQGKSMKEIRTYVPYVVEAITTAIREVIKSGARVIIVSGNFPIGCLPVYLTSFASLDPKAYDDKGCIREFNKFALFYNNHLQKSLAALGQEFPGVVIRYYDYYKAFQYILHDAGSLGFDQGSLLKACCGRGGEYNYNNKTLCASDGIGACAHPGRSVHWDGVHLTQQAYKYISHHLIKQVLPKIQG